MDGIDRAFQVALFDQKIKGGARRAERNHFHVDPAIGDRGETACCDSWAVLDTVANDADQSHVLLGIDFAIGPGRHCHEGFAGGGQILAGQE